MKQIRMKDMRNEVGTGMVIIEIETRPGSDCFTTLNHTFFFLGKPIEVSILSDDIKEVSILQITKPRYTWTKKTKNEPWANTRFFNQTILSRKEAPLKKKGDC